MSETQVSVRVYQQAREYIKDCLYPSEDPDGVFFINYHKLYNHLVIYLINYMNAIINAAGNNDLIPEFIVNTFIKGNKSIKILMDNIDKNSNDPTKAINLIAQVLGRFDEFCYRYIDKMGIKDFKEPNMWRWNHVYRKY